MLWRVEFAWSAGSNAVQLKDGNFRSHVESHLQEVADSATDVHSASARQAKFSRGVVAIFYRQERRRKKRWTALSPVGVPCENPAGIGSPTIKICRIRIMAQYQC